MFEPEDLSEDAFLGGALRICQPKQGFRSGLDAVLLAASVRGMAREHVLEVGAGAGVASLCLARRVRELAVTGLEIDPDLAQLANRNAVQNGLASAVRFEAGSLEDAPASIARTSFAHVFANPPYMEEGAAMPARDPGRMIARLGPQGVLDAFADFCLRRAESGGSVTLIHRADRLSRLLTAFEEKLGAIKVFPLWPRLGVAAKRVIVSGRKGSRAPLTLCAGLVLHGEGNAFTPEAEAVLRGGGALLLDD